MKVFTVFGFRLYTGAFAAFHHFHLFHHTQLSIFISFNLYKKYQIHRGTLYKWSTEYVQFYMNTDNLVNNISLMNVYLHCTTVIMCLCTLK